MEIKTAAANSEHRLEKDSEITKVSVCIPTHKRPVLLEKLLNSLEAQQLPAGVELEIIVVDNDAQRSAEEVVKKFSRNSVHDCRYYMQPDKNISITRNMAVKKASGDLILFIDDDNYASRELVKEHLDTLKRYNADLVIGLVEPYFHDATPEWLRDYDYYYSPMTKTGSDAKYTWASNTLIKASVIKQFEEPFDINYGITGGEDTHFFSLLEKQGYKIKNSREAVSREFIPPERTTHKYMFTRSFKGGNAYVRRIADENRSRKLIIYTEQFIKGSLQIIFYSIKFLLTAYSRKKRFKSLLKVYANLGKVSAVSGFIYKGYK
jgi:succinoglycan biosynthesis protein ExoM